MLINNKHDVLTIHYYLIPRGRALPLINFRFIKYSFRETAFELRNESFAIATTSSQLVLTLLFGQITNAPTLVLGI